MTECTVMAVIDFVMSFIVLIYNDKKRQMHKKMCAVHIFLCICLFLNLSSLQLFSRFRNNTVCFTDFHNR